MPSSAAWRNCKRCLACECFPAQVFGHSIDNIFAFYTTKVVAIQDRALGLLRIGFMLTIFCYIFMYKMWYQGSHFEVSEVEGLTRQDWQEPTMNVCNPRHLDCKANFTKIQNLGYCRQYSGADPNPVQRPCKYFDARELPITMSNGILIPTYIQKFRQVKDCEDGDLLCERKFHFVDRYGLPQRGHGAAEPEKRDYVADVEDFLLTIDHSFRTTDGKVAYDDFLMQGYWAVCDKDLNREDPQFAKKAALIPRQRHCVTEAMKCIHWSCELPESVAKAGPVNAVKTKTLDSVGRTRDAVDDATHFLRTPSSGGDARARARRSRSSSPRSAQEFLDVDEEDGASEVADDEGMFDGEETLGDGRPSPEQLARAFLYPDGGFKANQTVVSMKGGDVLTLRTLLMMAGESLDETWDDEDEGKLSLRLRGTALMVNIHYDNIQPWTLMYPQDPPWYTISVTSRPAHKFLHSFISEESGDVREMTWAYGVYVIIKQTGHIRTFNTITALMTLTSAMVLLGLSDFFVSMLAAYAMPKRVKYRALMYETSDEMGAHDSDEDSTTKSDVLMKKEQDYADS